jgi:hypothetical protein
MFQAGLDFEREMSEGEKFPKTFGFSLYHHSSLKLQFVVYTIILFE